MGPLSRPLSILALATFVAACATNYEATNPNAFDYGEGGVILVGEQARSAANQCSRPSPAPVSGTWTPSRAQIDDLETNLVPYFLSKSGDSASVLGQYFRQYAGLIIAGRKIIYVNAIAGWAITRDRSMDQRFTNAVHICDGGRITFGVEYDPDTKRFDNLLFNTSL